MMVVASLIAVASGVAGLCASACYNVSAGAAIVLACTFAFAVIYLARYTVLRRQPAPQP